LSWLGDRLERQKGSIDNIVASFYSHPVSTGWSWRLHLTRRTVSTVFISWYR